MESEAKKTYYLTFLGEKEKNEFALHVTIFILNLIKKNSCMKNIILIRFSRCWNTVYCKQVQFSISHKERENKMF